VAIRWRTRRPTTTWHSYSPYENVEAKPYPAILATGGLSDPRVTWWEPRVDGAAARTNEGERPILLKINMEAGHGGASGRFEFLKEIALDYAFAIWAIEGKTGGSRLKLRAEMNEKIELGPWVTPPQPKCPQRAVLVWFWHKWKNCHPK